MRNDAINHKNMVLRRKAAGKCAGCGIMPPFIRPGGRSFVRCRTCLEKGRSYKDDTASATAAIEWRRKLKLKVYAAYGNKCVCCGENSIEFLTIDHVSDDGALHRNDIGSGSSTLHRWAVKNNYPPSLQLLCANCHLSKTRSGVCAHKTLCGDN